jgi:hypothetical protein
LFFLKSYYAQFSGPQLFSYGQESTIEDLKDEISELVSIGPQLFSYGQSGHFWAFTDIEKKADFHAPLQLITYILEC